MTELNEVKELKAVDMTVMIESLASGSVVATYKITIHDNGKE